MVTLCEAVQAVWKEHLNIDVDLYPTDHQSFTSTVFREKKIPMYFVGYSRDYFDPSTFLAVFRSGGRTITGTVVRIDPMHGLLVRTGREHVYLPAATTTVMP